jgi:hypothetical protein
MNELHLGLGIIPVTLTIYLMLGIAVALIIKRMGGE